MDDETEAELVEVRREMQRDREDVRRLRTELRALESKIQFPGGKFLIDAQYKLIHDATTNVDHSIVMQGPVIETLPGALHALYQLSAVAVMSTTPLLITDGSVVVAPSNAVTVALQRQRLDGPTRTEVRVVYYNTTGIKQDIAVKVWRRLGMGG